MNHNSKRIEADLRFEWVHKCDLSEYNSPFDIWKVAQNLLELYMRDMSLDVGLLDRIVTAFSHVYGGGDLIQCFHFVNELYGLLCTFVSRLTGRG